MTRAAVTVALLVGATALSSSTASAAPGRATQAHSSGSKGDEPGRGAGGTEHDEGCAPGHDTDRAIDDGHACHHATAGQAATPASGPTFGASQVPGPTAAVRPPVGAVISGSPVVGTAMASHVAPDSPSVLTDAPIAAVSATTGLRGGSLAFTGLRLMLVALLALLLLASGAVLVRVGAGHRGVVPTIVG